MQVSSGHVTHVRATKNQILGLLDALLVADVLERNQRQNAEYATDEQQRPLLPPRVEGGQEQVEERRGSAIEGTHG